MVLQLQTLNDESIAESTAELVIGLVIFAFYGFLLGGRCSWNKGSLSSEELAQHLGISVILAKERFKTAEKYGKCCRDDSMEGLRFYPNLFLSREV